MADHRINMTANFSQYDAAIKDAINNMRTFGKIANTAGQQSNAGAMKYVKSLQNIDSQAITTRQRMTAMNTLLKEMEMQYNRLGDAAKKGAFGTELMNAIEQARQKVNAYNKELQGVGVGDGVSGGGKGLFGSILGGNLAARAVMDTLRFAKNTIKDAIDINKEFEYSNAELSAVLGRTKEEIIDLTIQARKLGSTSLYSANEITQLQIVLARLGFNQQEIEDSTDAIAKLALATGVDLDKAATLTGSTLRAFGYDAKEAARVASVLGVSTTKSALDMQKLTVAMSYASSVSRQAGFDIEEVVAILGKMVDNGMQATTAGVNVRNIMLELTDKSSRLSKAIKKVTGKDQIRGFDEFISALRQMRDAGINLEDVSATMEKRVTNGFLNILANTDGVTALKEELSGCTGELDKMAEKMEDTVSGAARKLSNAWSGLMITFQNNNGVLKETYEWLTKIINQYAKYRIMRFGGDSAVAELEKAGDNEAAQKRYDEMKAQGMTDEKILELLQKERNKLTDLEQKTTQEYNYYVSHQNDGIGGGGVWSVPVYNFAKMVGAPDIWKPIRDAWEAQNKTDELIPIVADIRSQINTLDMVMAKAGGGVLVSTGPTADDISGNAGLGLGQKEKTAIQNAEERVEGALTDYEIAIRRAALEKEAGYINEEQYTKKILSAEERLFNVYGDVAAMFDNPEFKQNFENEAVRIKELSEVLAKLIAARKAAEEAERESTAQLRAQTALDRKILRGLEGVANRAKIGYDAAGLTGIGERINMGIDISESEWNALVNNLNVRLKGLNLDKIRIEFDTGSIEKVKSDLEIFKTQIGNMSAVVGGISSIKSSIEGLVSAFEEGKEPLDMFLTVFDSGLSMIQSGIAIYEAITKLQEISTMLTEAHTAAKLADTAATETNTVAPGANAVGKEGEAAAAGLSAEMHTIDAASKAAGSVAWIPIIGGILAAAAVAALIGSLISARNQSKQVGYMADGGIVGRDGMVPRGTDTVPTMLTPGEVVLNAAMSRNLAGQLQGAGMQRMLIQGESYVSGEQIKIAYNNYSRRRGLKTKLA